MPLFLSSCATEMIRRQEAEIRGQREELARLGEEASELQAAKRREADKRRECRLAFREFEKAQELKEAEARVALYRKGLKLCPDDDVAHYELGRILRSLGEREAARREFESALELNPNFHDARRELEGLKGSGGRQ